MEHGRGALEDAYPEVRLKVESLLAQDISPNILDYPPTEILRAVRSCDGCGNETWLR
jgi:hypothetical protein